MIFLIHQHTTQVTDASSTAAEKHMHLGGAIKAGSQATQSVPDSQSDKIKVISERKGKVEKVTSTQVGGQKGTTSSNDKPQSNVNGYSSTLVGIDSSSRQQGDQITSDLEVLIATAYICVCFVGFQVQNAMYCCSDARLMKIPGSRLVALGGGTHQLVPKCVFNMSLRKYPTPLTVYLKGYHCLDKLHYLEEKSLYFVPEVDYVLVLLYYCPIS